MLEFAISFLILFLVLFIVYWAVGKFAPGTVQQVVGIILALVLLLWTLRHFGIGL